jgi:transcription elongation factor Elf1
MWLAHIEPDIVPGHDERHFECPRCQHTKTEKIKFR